METIKVNMNPNPLDVQTIHASQNDGEARQWEFILHNNGDVIDSSEVTDQMVFKAYKGGTEQLLPENTSTPATSPFKGDIKYPQGLLNDQEFTYRQSPTEEDGLAKITDIKGNTLVWNQLIKNGNFETATDWINSSSSYTVSNGVATVKSTNASNQFGIYQRFQRKANHTYFISFEMHPFGTIRVKRNKFSGGQDAVTEGIYQRIETALTDTTLSSAYQICFGEPVSDVDADYFTLKNYMIIDLTQMGLDITDPSEFTSLFPLHYYSYNQGSLLSFNGNGIKTVGANLILFADGTRTGTGITGTVSDGMFSASGTATSTYANLNYFNEFKVKNGEVYTVGLNKVLDCGITFRFATDTSDTVYQQATIPAGSQIVKFTANNDYNYVRLYISGITRGTVVSFSDMIPMIANAELDAFVPYTENTTSLPISTYFPTGTKSAGNVYDELTESKAITRIGVVDLGTLSFFYNSSSGFFTATIPDLVTGMTYATESPNVTVQGYEYKGGGVGWANMPDMSYGFNGQDMRIKNTAYTTTADFTNAVRGTYMVYELDTYEETSFTTASLVTENAEIPLSNDDGVLIGKCTEELSAEPGFHDAKIKLSDSDGTCYSNKLQLHVERSPQ